MENTSISSNIKYWENEVSITKEMIKLVSHKSYYILAPRMVGKKIQHETISAEINNLNYELKEKEKNLNFWLWVNHTFGGGYEETFNYPREDDE